MPLDAEAWYELGILLLEASATGEGTEVGGAADALKRSLELGRISSWTFASLGYAALVSGNSLDAALGYLSEAQKLDPDEQIFETYVLSLLIDSGAESEALAGIEAAAARHHVDLAALRHELEAVGFPVTADSLLINGFIHPRIFFVSWLQDEAERVRRATSPRSKRLEAEATHCFDAQKELERDFDARGVPESCRELSSWARRLGVGDDTCRPLLFKRLSQDEREELINLVSAHAEAANVWLDGFGERPMSAEAAAMMYLLSGVEEELRDGSASGT